MTGKRVFLAASIVAIAVILRAAAFAQAAEEMDAQITAANDGVQSLTPLSLALVDEATSALSQGWDGMSPDQREAFLTLFDPAGTGTVDEAYAAKVLANYQEIRAKLADGLPVVYAAEDDMCEGKRLYYTDIARLHVCPYFFEEKNELRKARTLIHEMAHAALLVTDRPYYRPTSKAYAQLTPEGSWPARLPVVGRLLREVLRDDTLYHPDAYAHFALLSAGYTNIYAAGDQAVGVD